MAITGRLQELSFLELLDFIANGSRSGILTLSCGVSTARLVVSGGRLVYASSDSQPRLGYTLVEKGLVAGDDIEQVLQLQARGAAKPLGRLLVEHRLVPRGVLETEIAEHIRNVVACVLSWDDASWSFEVREIPEEQIVFEAGLEVPEVLGTLSAGTAASRETSGFDTELWP